MASSDDLRAAIEAATQPVPAGVEAGPARFALLVRPTEDSILERAEIEAALAPLGARVRRLSELETDVLVLELPGRVSGADDARAFAAAYVLAELFDLAAAEPDLPTNFFPVPSDRPAGAPVAESVTDFPPGCWAPAQPELDATPRWALAKLRVEEAWQFSVDRQRPDRGAGIIIAQPDTGITNHPELSGVPLVSARDVLDDDADPTDPLNPGHPGHGTGTASVAVSRAAAIVVGTAPLSQHMPIRAIENVVRVTQVTVAEAMEWAVAHGAHVITMSLGGIPSFSLHRALRRAVAADVIVLAAAGNCVRLVVWPARYDDCIAVAGTDADDKPWRGSCRGAAVDVSAPGQNVIRAQVGAGTPPEHSVGQGQGTSFAVALTAGVAALWLAHHGRANLVGAARARGETLQAMFRRLIKATARRPADWDVFNMGAGVLDARALLEADLDAGRDLESAPQPDNAGTRDAIAMQSFVLESTRLDPATAPIDWRQFGPEIAAAVLRARVQRGTVTRDGPTPEGPVTEGARPSDEAAVVSPQLAAALAAHPALQTRLGLRTESHHG